MWEVLLQLDVKMPLNNASLIPVFINERHRGEPHKLHDEANFPGSWIPLDAVESDDVRVAAACLGPPLSQELLIDEILTRLPVDTAVCFRAVCRAWNEALASDYFVTAHAARAASACHLEIIFFSPTVRGVAMSFYACSIPVNGGAPPTVSVRQVCARGEAAASAAAVRQRWPAAEAEPTTVNRPGLFGGAGPRQRRRSSPAARSTWPRRGEPARVRHGSASAARQSSRR
ncbi:hypothetical protein D1007_30410 [Hordeum vulgare]|nr:hypothetical protein D1007_30410 [Hordeum vulgare]